MDKERLAKRLVRLAKELSSAVPMQSEAESEATFRSQQLINDLQDEYDEFLKRAKRTVLVAKRKMEADIKRMGLSSNEAIKMADDYTVGVVRDMAQEGSFWPDIDV